MKHWSLKYIGQRWTQEKDCYWWFREILKNEFNVEIPVVCAGYDRSFQVAAKLLTNKNGRAWGWIPTENPKEGDAVFLSRSKKYNTHIGIVFYIKSKLMILHALSEIGVVASDKYGLKINGFYEKGYWTYANKT